MKIYDVIIAGGGPAGLSAALVLGRCRRSVVLFDAGNPRNKHSLGIHNYLTRDGVLPRDFLRVAVDEIRRYQVKLMRSAVVDAKRKQKIFVVKDDHGKSYHAKKLLIATGLKDHLPPIDGIESFFGKSVFHCPYCDGWEVKDKNIGVYSRKRAGIELALSLKTWSQTVTLYTDGRNYLRADDIELLKRKQIQFNKSPVKSVEGNNGFLKKIVFADNRYSAIDALFFVTGYDQQSSLPARLGCNRNRNGLVITNRLGETGVVGVYVAGDSSVDVQFVIVAAAEGAKAGVTINKQLQKEELIKGEKKLR
jgi:thioredoxin reductase